MPLKLGSLAGNSTKKILGKGSVFSNPIYVALIIVGITIILIYVIMKREVETVYDDISFESLVIKIGVWSLVANMMVAFLHDKAVENIYEEKYKNKSQSGIIDRVIQDSDMAAASMRLSPDFPVPK